VESQASWYLIAPPKTRRSHLTRSVPCHNGAGSTVVEVKGSHARDVSATRCCRCADPGGRAGGERQRRRIGSSHKTANRRVVVLPRLRQRLSHSIPAPFQPLHLALSNGSRQTRISSVLDFPDKMQLKVSDLRWPTIRAQRLAGSRVKLGTERESLLPVPDKNADFGGQATAGRPLRQGLARPLKGSQNGRMTVFSEFCRKSHAGAWAIPRCSQWLRSLSRSTGKSPEHEVPDGGPASNAGPINARLHPGRILARKASQKSVTPKRPVQSLSAD